MKQRMTSVDVAGEAACLHAKLLGLRVANIYDINAKTYVIKLARSGEDGEKVFLLLESGSRFHVTKVMQDRSDVPSNFTLKLRKHIRTRRLEAVRQLGVDRVVDFVFGSGEAAYHLILEMYSQGNIVLTDSKYEVLTLLRSHRDDDKGFAVMARHPYPMHVVRLRQQVTEQELATALQAGAEQGQNLKASLAALIPYGPAIAEHCLLDAGLSPNTKLSPEDKEKLQGSCAALLLALGRLDAWFSGLEQAPAAGFITLAPPGGKNGKQQQRQQQEPQQQGEGGEGEAAAELFLDFNPLKLRQSEGQRQLEFETFDGALEEFFSKVAGQRAALARADAERAALGKLDKIKSDQAGRVSALQREADEAQQRAALIEYNLEAVDAAIAAVNEALASGMDWRELDLMIRDERKAGNPVACLIHSLQLESNRITLLLGNYLDDDDDEVDEEAMTRPASKVQVDLSFSAHSNARLHYDARKKHVAKQAKTLAANEAALKAAEKKAAQQLLQVRSQPLVAAPRKPFWFERFHWFISSENYLVISGRDAQQNELIVKRYFTKGDAYVHAELHGASSTIVKNPNPDKPIPPLTLQQAGCACVCRSRAWDSKIVTSAWWVHHHQVSKAAPSGEYLPTGSFMIRGRKNYLPPQPLVFGFGYMFKLEEGSIAAHLGERAPKLGLGEDDMPGEEGQEEEEEEGVVAGGEDEGGEAGGSALERFLEGGVDALARSTHSLSLGRATSASTSVSGSVAGVGGVGKGRAGSGHTGGVAAAKSYERYGLVVGAEAHEEGEGEQGREGAGAGPREGGDNQGGQGKKRLSAKERELLKKGRQGQGQGGEEGDQRQQGDQQQRQGQQKEGGAAAGRKAQAAAAAEAAAAAAAASAARGRKGKQQKMKERYADQDEEERALALALLASQGEKKSRADRVKERKERKEAKRKGVQTSAPLLDADAMQDAIAKATGKQFGAAGGRADAKSKGEKVEEQEEEGTSGSGSESDLEEGSAQAATGPSAVDAPGRVASGKPAPGETASGQTAAGRPAAVAGPPTGAGSRGVGRPGTNGLGTYPSPPDSPEVTGEAEGGGDDVVSVLPALEEGGAAAGASTAEGGVSAAERAEIAALLAEENAGPELDDAAKERLTVLDSLTGVPRTEDLLLSAIPVCGPYQALQNYKFKVKLTPGTVKKGKAARQALELLVRAPEAVQREKELLKAIPEMDMVNAMVGQVKISMPGLQKLKQADKSNRKAKAKAQAKGG